MFRDGEYAVPVGGGPDDPNALLTGVPNVPASIQRLIEALIEASQEPATGELGTGAALAGSVIALARARHALDAELARRATAAALHEALPHATVTTLERDGRWSGRAAGGLWAAARFAQDHPSIGDLWRSGAVSTDAVAALARGLRILTSEQQRQVVAACVPELPGLSIPGVKALAARAVELLRPADRERAEQRDWDARGVVFSNCLGGTIIHAQLPTMEGDALHAVLTALAESLRREGDGLTTAQRRADALITLVNRASAQGHVPPTSTGLPVATTITIGLSEAERLTRREARRTDVPLTDLVQHGGDPASLAATVGGASALGDAAARFAVCCGDLTGAVVDDRDRRRSLVADALTGTRVQPLALGRSTRLATAAQRKALALRDGGCVVCRRPPAECQTHHVRPWSEGGTTDLGNLALLCWVHHRAVDLNRWRLTRTTRHGPGAPYWDVTGVPLHQWRPRH